MRKRSVEIIQEIMDKGNESLNIKEFADKYHVSLKTLRNDIKEINEFLHAIPSPGIYVSEKGFLKKEKHFDDALIEKNLHQMNIYTYKLSSQERQIYIMMILTASRHHVTMQTFAEELCVSRITIVKDIEIVKDMFLKKGAELILDPGKGMLLKCRSKIKKMLLIEMYRKISIHIQSTGILQRLIIQRMHIDFRFSSIYSCMQEYMQISKIVFVEDVFYDIVLYIFVVFNFFRENGKSVSSKEKLSGIDHMILYAGHTLGVYVTPHMLNEFREYIDKKGANAFVKTVDEIGLYKVIMHFVKEIDRILKYGLLNDTKLIDALFMHIMNMKDWGNFEFELPKEHNTFIDYEILMDQVTQKAPILENFLCYQLSEKMKKSIVIHICVSIIRNQRYMPRNSVIIVCPGSMATGKFLEAQIKDYFDFKIIGVLAADEVENYLKAKEKNVDFIISTVYLEIEEYPVLKVQPILTMENLNSIQKMAFRKKEISLPHNHLRIVKLKEVIRDIIEDRVLANVLCEQMEETIISYQKERLEIKNRSFIKYLKKPYIQINEEDLTWEQAMQKAAWPLEKAGFIDHLYIQKSIEMVEEYGDYIVVSQGVALAHANKEYGVKKDCLGLFVSRKGIVFSQTPCPIYLLFCFADTGEHEYLHLIKSIIKIGKEKDRTKKISSLDNIEDIYQHIIQIV